MELQIRYDMHGVQVLLTVTAYPLSLRTLRIMRNELDFLSFKA